MSEQPGESEEAGGQELGGQAMTLAERVLVALCLAFTAYVLFNLTLFEYGRDQGIYAVVADTMRKGGAPYRDAWDFKPPGIFFVYAAARALLGEGQHAVRVLEAAGFASIVGAFALLSRRVVGSLVPGVIGGTLAALTEAQLEFWHTAQPESFGAVALSWALVCATYAPREGDAKGAQKELAALAGAGALYTAAALLKPPLGGGFVVSAVAIAWRLWRVHEPAQRLGAIVRAGGAYAGGAAAVLGLTLAYFAAKGALADLHHTLFVFTPYYTKLSFRPEWFWGFVYLAFEQWAVGYSALAACGVGLFLAMGDRSPRVTGLALHAMGLVLFQVVGVGMQAKFFPYHYGAALPFGALLAGFGFYALFKRAIDNPLLLVFSLWLISMLAEARTATRDLEDTFWTRCRMRREALFSPEKRIEINDHLYSVADVNVGANRRVAAWLAEHTPADRPVFVWGFEPVIYDMAKRRPASRYIYNVPQRVEWATETREVLMRELRERPPSAIVVERRDVFPAVTGNRYDSNDSLQGFSAMATFLREGYWLVHSIEDFDIYEQRGSTISR